MLGVGWDVCDLLFWGGCVGIGVFVFLGVYDVVCVVECIVCVVGVWFCWIFCGVESGVGGVLCVVVGVVDG